LRESVDLTRNISDRQERDMRASITEAGRAAGAMEKVARPLAETAASALENTAIVKEMSERQARLASMQLRAYVSVLVGNCIPQDRTTGWRYEVRMIVTNTGHTPAHAVTVTARLEILPFPLPDDIDLNVPIGLQEESSHINTGQQRFFRRWLNDLIPDEEINEIMRGSIRKLYIYGSIFYRDAFGEAHSTNFCQFAMWDIAGNFSTMNTNRHNDAT
jgi:hypothetical protein